MNNVIIRKCTTAEKTKYCAYAKEEYHGKRKSYQILTHLAEFTKLFNTIYSSKIRALTFSWLPVHFWQFSMPKAAFLPRWVPCSHRYLGLLRYRARSKKLHKSKRWWSILSCASTPTSKTPCLRDLLSIPDATGVHCCLLISEVSRKQTTVSEWAFLAPEAQSTAYLGTKAKLCPSTIRWMVIPLCWQTTASQLFSSYSQENINLKLMIDSQYFLKAKQISSCLKYSRVAFFLFLFFLSGLVWMPNLSTLSFMWQALKTLLEKAAFITLTKTASLSDWKQMHLLWHFLHLLTPSVFLGTTWECIRAIYTLHNLEYF